MIRTNVLCCAGTGCTSSRSGEIFDNFNKYLKEYGFDGRVIMPFHREIKERDFSEVRGDFESNSFVTAVLEHIKVKEALGNELIERLKR